jgi:Domain of unknown function (DUF4333)
VAKRGTRVGAPVWSRQPHALACEWMTRKPLAAIAAVSAVALSACGSSGSSSSGTLHTANIEQAIRSSILAQHNVHTTVHCPPTVPLKAGQSFTCLANLDVGSYPVTATITNSSGHIRYGSGAPLVVINIAKVQSAIEASIFSQRTLRATVVCPQAVLQQAGLTFTCLATAKGRTTPFKVTQTDANGHVRYEGLK